MNTVHIVFTTGKNSALIRPFVGMSLRLRRLTTAAVAGMVLIGPTTSRANAPAPIQTLKIMGLEALAAVKVAPMVGAAKHEENVFEAPANVSVFTAEALRSVTGLQATDDRQTTQGGLVGTHWIVQATIYTRALISNLELSLSFYNRFNEHFNDLVSTDFTPAAAEPAGRALRLKGTWDF